MGRQLGRDENKKGAEELQSVTNGAGRADGLRGQMVPMLRFILRRLWRVNITLSWTICEAVIHAVEDGKVEACFPRFKRTLI